MATVIGIGGVFFKCEDRDRLVDWYRRYLGFAICDFPGTNFTVNTDIPFTVWGPFERETRYFDPSTKDFMINLVVDNVAEALEQARSGGAEIVGDMERYEYGEFGWFLDPEGNKIELWDPATTAGPA